jgi:hypothetical protein
VGVASVMVLPSCVVTTDERRGPKRRELGHGEILVSSAD